jgi:hypothetical protein
MDLSLRLIAVPNQRKACARSEQTPLSEDAPTPYAGVALLAKRRVLRTSKGV